MADQTAKILENIKIALRDEPLSISEISEKVSINWRTAENNLRILESLGLVFERNIKNRRTFFYKEKNNYFDLPVKNEDIKKEFEAQKIAVHRIETISQDTFRIQTEPIDQKKKNAIISNLNKQGKVVEKSLETIGPTIGRETQTNALKTDCDYTSDK